MKKNNRIPISKSEIDRNEKMGVLLIEAHDFLIKANNKISEVSFLIPDEQKSYESDLVHPIRKLISLTGNRTFSLKDKLSFQLGHQLEDAGLSFMRGCGVFEMPFIDQLKERFADLRVELNHKNLIEKENEKINR